MIPGVACAARGGLDYEEPGIQRQQAAGGESLPICRGAPLADVELRAAPEDLVGSGRPLFGEVFR